MVRNSAKAIGLVLLLIDAIHGKSFATPVWLECQQRYPDGSRGSDLYVFDADKGAFSAYEWDKSIGMVDALSIDEHTIRWTLPALERPVYLPDNNFVINRETWELTNSRGAKGSCKPAATQTVTLSGPYDVFAFDRPNVRVTSFSAKPIEKDTNSGIKFDGRFSISDVAQGWAGEGRSEGMSGFYDWRTSDGRVGRTKFQLNADGSAVGRAVGPGVDFAFIAKPPPPFVAVKTAAGTRYCRNWDPSDHSAKLWCLPTTTATAADVLRKTQQKVPSPETQFGASSIVVRCTSQSGNLTLIQVLTIDPSIRSVRVDYISQGLTTEYVDGQYGSIIVRSSPLGSTLAKTFSLDEPAHQIVTVSSDEVAFGTQELAEQGLELSVFHTRSKILSQSGGEELCEDQ